MNGEQFVGRINMLLKKKGKSKSEFYSDLGLANNSVTAWKKNQVPSVEIALKIAAYLDTSVEYLVTGTERNGYKEKYDALKMAMIETLQTN